MQNSKIAVYSCFFGDPEPYNPLATGNGEGYDRIVFTDRPELVSDGIEARVRTTSALGPLFESRRAKILPHRELPGYDWAIYVDNRASLLKHPEELIASLGGPTARPGLYVYRHLERARVRDELDECFRIGHLSEHQWNSLDALYDRTDLPDDLELTHNAVLIYKYGDPATECLSETWFELFLHFSKRDQLTMQVAEHISGCQVKRIGGTLSDVAKWPIYLPQERAVRMQSDQEYRSLPKLSLARLKKKLRKNRKKYLISAKRSRSNQNKPGT